MTEKVSLDLQEYHLSAVYGLLNSVVTNKDQSLFNGRNLRKEILGHFEAIGVKSLEDFSLLSEAYVRLDGSKRNLSSPAGYPDINIFTKSLEKLYAAKGREAVPAGVPDEVLASYVAAYAVAEWRHIEAKKGTGALTYLYELGKVMANEPLYTTVFRPEESIRIKDNWKIENGINRTLTLRILGSQYVHESGMDNWVVIKKVS